jgi:gamma-glutamylcyclotransferase (GGCT)/AIG2-like uncharacterized protein YtfP
MSSDFFSYGTLQAPEVILSVIGRRPAGETARLPGWRAFQMVDAGYPGIVPGGENDDAPGILYHGVSDGELFTLDRFEGPQYERRKLDVLGTEGIPLSAWVYVVKEERIAEVTEEPWRLEEFLESGLPEFMERFVRERRREYREE